MADAIKKTAKSTTKAAPKTDKKAAKQATEVKTIAQLREDVAKVQLAHQETRRSHRMGELVNPHVLTTGRKDIARALTALKQAEIAEKSANVSPKEEN